MFRCQGCNQNTVGKPRFVVTKRREIQHPHRGDDPGGYGTQIVQEVKLCTSCALEDRYDR